MQRTLFIAALLTVCSASSIASTPAPPAWLAPYIVKGALSYSNLDWARRRWSPDPKDQLEWRSALDWIAQFKGARAAEIVEDFRQAGVPGATLRAGCYGNEACQQVEDLQLGSAAFSGWDTLSGAAREATRTSKGIAMLSKPPHTSLPRIPVQRSTISSSLLGYSIRQT